MNRKTIILLLIIVVVLLVGAVIYFVTINKTGQPLEQVKEDNNFVDYGVQIYFKDGFTFNAGSSGNYNASINFGPQSKLEMMSGRRDLLDFGKVRTADAVIKGAEITETGAANPLITVKPTIKKRNGFVAVEWAEGGNCENRILEIIGTKYNYIMSSLGCQETREYDFKYFEDLMDNIKLTGN